MEGHFPAGAVWSPVSSAIHCKLATSAPRDLSATRPQRHATSAPIEPSGTKRTSYQLATKWCVIPISPRQTVTSIAPVLRWLHRPPLWYQAVSGMRTLGLQFAVQILLLFEYRNTPWLPPRALTLASFGWGDVSLAPTLGEPREQSKEFKSFPKSNLYCYLNDIV